MSETPQDAVTQEGAPRWRPLDKIARRVVGVLVEKAKTTPDNYPLSLNSLVNGCNQKSNRAPQMQLDSEQVAEAIDRLRMIGAVSVVQGDGRVEKYRHMLYEWLGVDKTELAVMTELLLRGEQTLGDLRARAARMEPIPGQAELQPIVDSLRRKGLLVLLTPPGRGCMVTRALYQEQELAKLRAEFAEHSSTPRTEERSLTATPHRTAGGGELEDLRRAVADLQRRLATIEAQVAEVDQLRTTVEELTRQLGV
jgi:uncharacterized protein